LISSSYESCGGTDFAATEIVRTLCSRRHIPDSAGASTGRLRGVTSTFVAGGCRVAPAVSFWSRSWPWASSCWWSCCTGFS